MKEADSARAEEPHRDEAVRDQEASDPQLRFLEKREKAGKLTAPQQAQLSKLRVETSNGNGTKGLEAIAGTDKGETAADTEADDTNDVFDQRLDQVGHSFVGTHFVGTP